MINPVSFTENVIRDFLRYQLSTYRFSDDRLRTQLRSLLNLDETRISPLLKGPYLSLSRPFKEGSKVSSLVEEGVLHEALHTRTGFQTVYAHQEDAMRSIRAGRNVILSTGTGSGKTEAFLYPIISRCLELRDQKAPQGVVALIVYPMNALAEDQLWRLRRLLAGTGVTFGMYVGKTPENRDQSSAERLPAGSSRATYLKRLERRQSETSAVICPAEERISRDEMREVGGQPRILLTNVKQLELLLTRQVDVGIFQDAPLEFLVFDEAHTYSGTSGAETSVLIRRLKSYAGRSADETVCIATSATIADIERGPEAGREFAARFFGVPADSVDLIGEQYEPQNIAWKDNLIDNGPPEDPAVLFVRTLDTLSELDISDPPPAQTVQALRDVVCTGLGAAESSASDRKDWRAFLAESFTSSSVASSLVTSLSSPLSLAKLCEVVTKAIGRNVSEPEVLLYLAIGVAARVDAKPIVRPVVHVFVKGINGAAVTFGPGDKPEPKLWLNGADVIDQSGSSEPPHALPVLTCTNCGQHYFEHFVEDSEFSDKNPRGGRALNDVTYWEALDKKDGGSRAILVDSVVRGDETDDELADNAVVSAKVEEVHFCRMCGCLHSKAAETCAACGRSGSAIRLYAVREHKDKSGQLHSCLACGKTGRSFRFRSLEPARAVRAQTPADVHILAQSMLQYQPTKRLLVFTDNRQDAAFQAGWMADHARRFRLMELIYDTLRERELSLGDLVHELDYYFEQDSELSRLLLREVWDRVDPRREARAHRDERRLYLRFQLLRELTRSLRDTIGLEVWGRLSVRYEGLSANHPFVRTWSGKLGIKEEEFLNGIATYLDSLRRGSNLLYDEVAKTFSKFWHDGDAYVQYEYLPRMSAGPKGLVLERAPGHSTNLVTAMRSSRGQTLAVEMMTKWGVQSSERDEFLEALWKYLTVDTKLLVAVDLLGRGDRVISGAAGVRQIDVNKLMLGSAKESWVCNVCHRSHSRPTPGFACAGWRCTGHLNRVEGDPEDYNLSMLEQKPELIRAKEHSAQVPESERERLERAFRGADESINTLVCTPTLELGVDIGDLDTILLRNVPPLPANYWQRVGRAGRRDRLAVDVTYARTVSHDQAYFQDPVRMLEGRIDPPGFNLRNEIMVRRHVHATVISTLYRLQNGYTNLTDDQRNAIQEGLVRTFPTLIRSYLFASDGTVLIEPYKADELAGLIEEHLGVLFSSVVAVFEQGWPETDADVVSRELLKSYVEEMATELDHVLKRLYDRLHAAMDRVAALDAKISQIGALDRDDDAERQRHIRFIRKMKQPPDRRYAQDEGVEDVYTFSVLSLEGFLPGYGLETGSVVASFSGLVANKGVVDFSFRRNHQMALREFVPGNMLYALGSRYVPSQFKLTQDETLFYQVDAHRPSVKEVGAPSSADGYASAGGTVIPTIRVCDADMKHYSQISDEEEYRFQMPVAIVGYDQKRHAGGRAFDWDGMQVDALRSMMIRLVNIGAGQKVTEGIIGYPICMSCGASASPLSSDTETDKFWEFHRQYHQASGQNVGFHTDYVCDALVFRSFEDATTAYSVVEALRRGASMLLNMDIEDLQLLPLSRGDDTFDMMLYDTMPGGCGLIAQLLDRWTDVQSEALDFAHSCPSGCDSACVDCLLLFRNSYYHTHLNRHIAGAYLSERTGNVVLSNDIPPANAPSPTTPSSTDSTNRMEDALGAMFETAGFTNFEAQKEIPIGPPYGHTYPDFYFPLTGTAADLYEGICVYLDGMSDRLHGNPQTATKDTQIRAELESKGYVVVAIPVSSLTDKSYMHNKIRAIGRLVVGRAEIEERISRLSQTDQ